MKSIIFTDDLDGNEIKKKFNVPVQIEIDGRAIEWKQTLKQIFLQDILVKVKYSLIRGAQNSENYFCL